MHKFIYMYFTQIGNSPLYFKLTHSGDDVQMDCYQDAFTDIEENYFSMGSNLLYHDRG